MNNWITRVIKFGEKIKKVIKERPTKEEILESSWIACCAGPVRKKEIFNDETQHVCPKCNKHYPLTPRQRFDFFFGKDNYTIIEMRSKLASTSLNVLESRLSGTFAGASNKRKSH